MTELSTDIKDNTVPKAENESQSIFVPRGIEARQELEEWIDKDLSRMALFETDRGSERGMPDDPVSRF